MTVTAKASNNRLILRYRPCKAVARQPFYSPPAPKDLVNALNGVGRLRLGRGLGSSRERNPASELRP